MVRAAAGGETDRLRPGPWRRCAPEGGAPPPWPGNGESGDQLAGQLTIGGEQQDPCTLVQPAHGGGPAPEGFRNRPNTVGGACPPGPSPPPGFVHHGRSAAPGQHRFPVQGDLRAGEGGSGSLGHDLSTRTRPRQWRPAWLRLMPPSLRYLSRRTDLALQPLVHHGGGVLATRSIRPGPGPRS